MTNGFTSETAETPIDSLQEGSSIHIAYVITNISKSVIFNQCVKRTNDSVRSQTKLTDLPLIIADRTHSLLRHVCHLYHQMCQPTTSSSTVSTSRRADALPPTGSVHLAGQRRPGYNRWKRNTGAQSTRSGHRRRIARCGGRYGPRWSGAAVSEWVSECQTHIQYNKKPYTRVSSHVNPCQSEWWQ